MLLSGFFLFCGLLLGRGMGLVREFMLANYVGSGRTADIVIALITLPDIVINIMLGNSLAIVFIPAIKKLDQSERFGYFLKLSSIVALIFVSICLAIHLNLDSLYKLILPNEQSSADFARDLSMVIWAIPLLAMNSVSRIFLQAEGKVALLGLENVLFNFCLIIAIFSFADSHHLQLISYGIILGCLLRWLTQFFQILQVYQLKTSGFKLPIHFSDLQKYNLAFMTGLLLQLLPVYGRTITSKFELDGALAIYNYAYKLIEFPMALGISIVSILLFPKLTEKVIQRDSQGHLALTQKSHSFILNLCLPAATLAPLLLFYATQQSFSFNQLSSENLKTIFMSVTVGLVFFPLRGLTELYMNIFNSLGDVKHPFYTHLFSILIGLVAVYFLTQNYGIYGSFWGLNICYLAAFLISIYLLKSKHQISMLPFILNKETFKVLIYNLVLCALFAAVASVLSFNISFIIWVFMVISLYIAMFAKPLRELTKKVKPSHL